MPLKQKEIERVIKQALAEDIGRGDVTTAAIIPRRTETAMAVIAREPAVICGIKLAAAVFTRLDKAVQITENVREGECVKKGAILMTVRGKARAILAGERVALNMLQHLSGIATLTARYVAAVRYTKARILDTRKTIPGLRMLEKYAVTVGGGYNHRMRLDDAVLIKDNHIALCSGIKEAIQKARAKMPPDLLLEVECDTLAQVEEALDANASRILLDNMPLKMLRKAVQLNSGRAELEASGGVTLKNVAAIAETGVDYISVGALTHSAPAIDMGMDRVA